MRFALASLGLLSLAACATTPSVQATAETAAVAATGDAADDPAIWIAPEASQSLVIATQKQGGLYVFDLSGAITQEIAGGRPNNVDIRDEFAWADGAAPIVGASDRTDNAIVLWRFDPQTRQLEPTPRARISTGFAEIYGFCLGRMGEAFVAVATNKDTGEVGVWRLDVAASGAVNAHRIVAYTLGSIAEGCVVDDDAGAYYVSQELEGIWRAELTDATGATRHMIDRVGQGGNLAADVEGLALWRGATGAGFLVASVQGRSTFAVYDRSGANAYRGAFTIGEGDVDGVEGTDGLDIVSAPLGEAYPRGLLVVQDDQNRRPNALQNFKYVSWAHIEAALLLSQ